MEKEDPLSPLPLTVGSLVILAVILCVVGLITLLTAKGSQRLVRRGGIVAAAGALLFVLTLASLTLMEIAKRLGR